MEELKLKVFAFPVPLILIGISEMIYAVISNEPIDGRCRIVYSGSWIECKEFIEKENR